MGTKFAVERTVEEKLIARNRRVNVRVIKRDERERLLERVSEVPKTADQAESETARRTIITIKAWVDELRQKQRAEIERAHRLLSEAA